MHARIRTILILGVAALAILAVSCGDDEGNPAIPSPEEIVLATIASDGTVQSSNQPPQPYSIAVNIGVAEELSPNFETPEPLLFEARSFQGSSTFTARAANTQNFPVVAGRMTDGVDGTAFHGVENFAGGASTTGAETSIFDYEPGLTLTGADLAGYTVTGIRFDVNLTVTPNGALWLMEYDYIVTVLGH